MKNAELLKAVNGNKSVKNTVFTYIFTFLFSLFFIVGLVSYFICSTVLDADKYIKRISSDEYSDAVLSAVYKDIDGMGDVITLGTDDVYDLLDKESVVEYSEKYTKAYLDSILTGEKFSDADIDTYSISYMREPLKKLVEDFYQTSDESFSDEEFEIIYDYVEKQINGSLKFLPSSILEKTNLAASYIVKVKSVFSYLKMALIPCVLLMLGIVLLNLKNIGKLFYRAGSALFIPSAILFIPAALFDGYNLGERVVLSKSPLSIVFSSAVDTVVKGFETQTVIFFLIALCMIIAGAALTVFKKDTETRKAKE